MQVFKKYIIKAQDSRMLFVNRSLAFWKTADTSHFKSLWISKQENWKLPLRFNWSGLESSTPYSIVVKCRPILIFQRVNDSLSPLQPEAQLSQAAYNNTMCLLRQHGVHVTTFIQTESSKHHLSRWFFCKDININTNTHTINYSQLCTCKFGQQSCSHTHPRLL